MSIIPWFIEYLLLNLLFGAVFFLGYLYLKKTQTNANGRFFYLKFIILSLPLLGFTPKWTSSSFRSESLSGTLAWVSAATDAPTASSNPTLHSGTMFLIFTLFYLIIALVRVTKFGHGMFLASRVASSAKPAHHLGTNIFVHRDITPTGVFGIIKPRICFSQNSLDSFSKMELDAILAHERIHIERRDPIFHAWALFTKAFFFLNPFASWLVARFSEDMELSADERVLLTQRLSVRSYAELLAKASVLESSKAHTAWSGVHVSQTFIVRRLSAMKVSLRKKTAAVVSILVGAIALSVFAASSVGTATSNTTTSGNGSCKAIELSLKDGPVPGTWSCADFTAASIPKPCDEKACYISLTMTPEAATRLEQATAANIGNKMVFKVNRRVFSEPVIREAITSKSLSMSGDFTTKEQMAVIEAVQGKKGE